MFPVNENASIKCVWEDGLCEEKESALWQLLRDVEKDAGESVYAETLCQDPSLAGRSERNSGVSVTESV